MHKQILLVEDDLRDIELIMIALERSQLWRDVIILRDGSEALDYLHKRNDFAERTDGNPSVILLDLKLPKVDGFGVLEAVRADEQLQRIPVAMLTSSNMEEDVARAYELGVNAYVVKPNGFNELISAVSELGQFWAVLNEPPPGSARAAFHPG
uniref:Response regulator-like protein n=1 Tax=Pseudomonas viridiflava TaxID=33069 RepID=I6LCH8_PSEVI|nr:response regulator-like protein [Pseudomonas viridiflava]